MKRIASFKRRFFAYHTGMRATRTLTVFLLTALASSLPYAEATVNPNNFSIRYGDVTSPTSRYYNIGTRYFGVPRNNAGYTDRYEQTSQETILNSNGYMGLIRRAGITRKTVNGAFKYSFYTGYNTTTASGHVASTRTISGYWYTRHDSVWNNRVQLNPYTGTVPGSGGYWYNAVTNDEYGNLIFVNATFNENTKNNYFPNNIYPVMVDGEACGSIWEPDQNLNPTALVQVSNYPTDYGVTGGYRGSCQLIQATGDIGTFTDQPTSSEHYGKGGYVWFAPYQATDYVFRVKLGYDASKNDKVGYKSAEKIEFNGKLTIPTGHPCCSCVGYGYNDDRMMVHDCGYKIWLCKYSNGRVTEAYDFSNGDGVSNNARFEYGAPTVFTLQGHNYLVTANVPANSGGMNVYEILENASGEIYLTQVYAKNPLTSKNYGAGTVYTTCTTNTIAGPAFSTVRHSAFHTMIMGLAWHTGYYTYDFYSAAKATLACNYIGTYKQNGTSTPTLRRIIVCNPPTNGEALSYMVFNSSNTDLTNGLLNVDTRTYIDDSASRCSSSSTYPYYSKGVYECDGFGRTQTTVTSPKSPTTDAAAIPAPLTNDTPVVNTFNYFDVTRLPNCKYDYSINQYGSAGTFKQYNLIVNGTASTVATNVTSGQQAGFLTSFAVTPVYHIDGHNDSAVSTNWDYYGTNRVLPTVDDVDYDCPKPASVSRAQSLQTTPAEVQQMNLVISWPTPVASPKATRNSYEVIVTDETTGEVVYTNPSVSASLNSDVAPDVWVGHTYSALVRSNYTYRGVTGHYSNIVPSAQIIPDYPAPAPQVDVTVKVDPNGTVAIWDEDHGWHNVTTPIYRMEVRLDEPAVSHEPVSYYQLEVNKNDGNGWQPFSSEELSYFPAGSGNITPSQLASTVIEPESEQPCTFYFYWDGYNLSTVPNGNHSNSAPRAMRGYAPTPSTNSPDNWTVRLTAVYGANNVKVLKSDYTDASDVDPGITSVDKVADGMITVKNITYYDLKGIRLSKKPTSGAYIEVALLSDGTISTHKLVAR